MCSVELLFRCNSDLLSSALNVPLLLKVEEGIRSVSAFMGCLRMAGRGGGRIGEDDTKDFSSSRGHEERCLFAALGTL